MSSTCNSSTENHQQSTPESENENERACTADVGACSSLLLMNTAPTSITAVVVAEICASFYTRKKRRTKITSVRGVRDPFYRFHLHLSDREFQRTFRVTRAAFGELLALLLPRLERDDHTAKQCSRRVQRDIRLALTLRMLAGGSYIDILMLFWISRSTAYDVFGSTIDGILEELAVLGVPLGDGVKLHDLDEGFNTSRSAVSLIWGCVGAFDGIVIKILKPLECFNRRSYFCRKGYFAIPVQAVVNSSYRFFYMSARAVGATHDSLAFAVSELAHRLNDREIMQGYWSAGDPAFEFLNDIVTPFTDSQLQHEELSIARDGFNFLQSSMRTHVEQAFGILVARFVVLWRPMWHALPRIPRVLGACMRIHNFCLQHNSPCIKRILSREEFVACEASFADWWEAATNITDNVE